MQLLIPAIALLSLVIGWMWKGGVFSATFPSNDSDNDSDALVHTKFLDSVFLRDCDPLGCGHFGAPRGIRTHKGLDIQSNPNTPFPAPFDCKIIRIGTVYTDFPFYSLVEIEGIKGNFKGWRCKLMYLRVLPSEVGNTLKKFEVFGSTENLHLKYDSAMINHVHLELRTPQGELVNPEDYL